jgi:hypothetical protein
MNFTSASILNHLSKSDPPFLNANYDVAAARVSGFCSQEQWAIIFELLMSYPSSDGIGLMICAYGTGVRVSQGFETPTLHVPFRWEKNLESERLDEEESEDIDEVFIPETVYIDIRGQTSAIQTKDIARLKVSPEFDFDLLVHIVDMYGDELFSTNDELSLYVSRGLKKIVRFDVWDCWEDEDKAVWENDRLHIPVYTSGVEVISQILETRNFDLCRSQSAKNLGFDWAIFE